jgi:hypothetical protein
LKASDVGRRSCQLSGGAVGVEADFDKVPRVLGRDGGASVKLS